MWIEIKPIDPDMWDWDKNPVLEGTLSGMESHQAHSGRDFWIYEIELGSGEKAKFFGNKIIDTRLQKNCELGTKIKITFLGNEIAANGNPYRNYRVEKWNDENAEFARGGVEKGKDDTNLSSTIKNSTNEALGGNNDNWQRKQREEFDIIDFPEEQERIDPKDIPF